MAQDQRVEFLFAAQVSGNEQLQKLITSVDSLRKETEQLKSANTGLAVSTEAVVRNGKRYNTALDAQSKALRNSRQGAQQLGMQFNDLATSISTGASPAQAFNQQIGQIGYALSMMEGRIGALGRLIAGPLGLVLIGATVLMSQFKKETKDTGEVTANFGDYAVATFASVGESISDSLMPAIKAVQPALTALEPVIESVGIFFKNLGVVGEMVANGLIRTFVIAVNSIAILASNSFGMVSELVVGTINVGIAAVNSLIAMVENSLNKIGSYINQVSDIFNLGFRVGEANFGRLEKITNKWAGTSKRAAADVGAAYRDALGTDFINGADISTRADALAAQRAANKIKKGEKGGGASESNSDAQRQQEEEAKSIESFMDKIGKVGMKEIPAYQREIAMLEKDFMELSKTGQVATIAPFKAAIESIEMNEYSRLLNEDIKDAQSMVKDVLSDTGGAPVSKEMDAIISRTEELNDSFRAVGMTVSDAFKGMLTGAMSWKDGMRSLIASVIEELWKLFVVQQIVGVVSSALGGMTGTPGGMGSAGDALKLVQVPGFDFTGKAIGGSVGKNTPYIVGEQGPELFIPGGSGTIIPNRNLSSSGGGSSFNITVDARGSNDPAAVRAQVQQGILEAAPAIIAAAESRTVAGLRRPRLGGVMQ